MNAVNDIAEARATAVALRASARACGPDQRPLKFRLVRAAKSLDAMVLIAVRGIERVEQLEMQLRQLQAAEHQTNPLLVVTPGLDADDIALLLASIDHYEPHVRAKCGNNLEQSVWIGTLSRILIVREKLRTMQAATKVSP